MCYGTSINQYVTMKTSKPTSKPNPFEYLYSNMLFGTISKNQDNNSDTEVNSNGR